MSPGRGAAAALLALAVTLGGCTTLGSHVKGSFSCQAPQGICAPSSTIDDRALAMIAGETGAAASPAGPFVPRPTKPRPLRTAAIARPLASTADAQRTGEKVLRVVFQPYVDDYGRLHEASVVRTVVRGEWQAAAAVPPAVRAVDPTMAGASLAEAVERADPPVGVAAVDPDMPSAAAVAAARAKLDPVASIKADVASRLAARSSAAASAPARVAPRARGARPVRTATSTPFAPPGSAAAPAGAPRGTAAAPQVMASAPVTRPATVSALPASAAVPAPPPAFTAADAAARVRSDPRVAAAAAAAQAGGRQGAVAPVVQPGQPVVRPTSFPGTDPEDN